MKKQASNGSRDHEVSFFESTGISLYELVVDNKEVNSLQTFCILAKLKLPFCLYGPYLHYHLSEITFF